jgi:regulator of protease activity HflC (stomatin/prohibitin superfamily)
MAKQMDQKQSQNSEQDGSSPAQIKAAFLKPTDNRRISGIAIFVFAVILVIAAIGNIFINGRVSGAVVGVYWAVLVIISIYFLYAIKVARQWEKAVVLRLGHFSGLKGPGLFWIVPIVDSTPVWIDHRVMVTPFNAEKTLAKDTVPVDVDAVLFWVVWDAEKAALEVVSGFSSQSDPDS